jgi:hypothetical protein
LRPDVPKSGVALACRLAGSTVPSQCTPCLSLLIMRFDMQCAKLMAIVAGLAATPSWAASATSVALCQSEAGDCARAGCLVGPDPCTSKAGCYSYWVD